jgi:8-oxo-dGTP pyrophosphatase MutT (NUDIX family)
MLGKFRDFKTHEVPSHKAGVAIVYDGKVLVAHATNSSWKDRSLGIPKGSIEYGENEREAAARELYEELGIQVDPNSLGASNSLTIFSSTGKAVGTLTYFTLKINSLKEIGLDSLVVPRDKLQIKEVDWAGFISISELYKKLYSSQLIILDRLQG